MGSHMSLSPRLVIQTLSVETALFDRHHPPNQLERATMTALSHFDFEQGAQSSICLRLRLYAPKKETSCDAVGRSPDSGEIYP